MRVIPVPVREDNYAYLLIDEATKQAAAVDPYDVPKVQAAADREGVRLVSVLTTHHHHDHAGGNKKFAAKYPEAPIYGGSERGEGVTHIVKDGDVISVGETVSVKCIATPCHTQDSICFHVTSPEGAAPHAGGVFTGDTLFIGGCGRFFEGSGAEMHAALSKLGNLPDETVVYNGHEYTAGNAAFGTAVEPDNAAIQRLVDLAKENKITTGLTTIGEEKEWNVFMRLDSETVLKKTGFATGADEGQVMDKLREGKNSFRG